MAQVAILTGENPAPFQLDWDITVLYLRKDESHRFDKGF